MHAASFHEQAVTVGSAPWALPGTLTMPDGKGPFPAVVLVAGSGAQDRDETVGANQPFRDLAWGLASRGVAVLRYDKRTLVYAGRIAKLTGFTLQDEIVDDAKAAAGLLTRMPGVDARHIYVLGHSLGGTAVPLVARQDARIAGLVIMAGPTRPLVDVLFDQYLYFQSRGLITAAQVAAVKKQVEAIDALTPADAGRGSNLMGAPASYWLYLRDYHPAAVARGLSVPMLIMQGARDYQVTLADFSGWKQALAGRQTVTFKLYANLFHLFIPVPPGSPAGLAMPAAYGVAGHVDPQVIADIAAWVTAARW